MNRKKKLSNTRDNNSPSQKSQEEIVKKQWNNRYKEEKIYSPKDEVIKFIEKNWKTIKNGPFVDIGCGNGRNLLYGAKKGLEMHGMDISKESLIQLQKQVRSHKLKAIIQEASFYNLPYKDKTFFGGMCINAYQHNNWQGAEKSFAEVSRVLADRARFLLMVRSTQRAMPKERTSINERGITFIPQKGTKAGIMIHHYTEEEIRELAEKNCLKIRDMKEVVRHKKAQPDEESGKRGHWIVTLKRKPRKETQHFISKKIRK